MENKCRRDVSSNTEDFYRLKESDISSVVKALDIEKKNGIGLLFVMEGMKKIEKRKEKAFGMGGISGYAIQESVDDRTL